MLFEEQLKELHLGNFYLSQSNPGDPALFYHDETVTYGELDQRIGQYMSLLQDIGVKPGDTVALSCYNTPEFIYSYFAIIKTGATVVPINLTLTLEEISYILKDSHTHYMMIHEKILLRIGGELDLLKGKLALKQIILLGMETTEKIKTLPAATPISLSPQGMSTILYTSGTTGSPKGAMLTHQNLVQNTFSCAEALHPVGKDIFVCVLPMFHTFGFTTSVLLPLFMGSSLVIHETFHPKEIINSIVNRQISVFCGVPAMFIVLAQALKEGKVTFPSLRLAVSGGSPLPVEILTLFNHHYKIPLMEGYGLTEASPVVCFNPVLGEKKPGSVGLPLQNIEVKIIGENGTSLPQGEVGEILVKGPNVMLGYLGMEEETEKTIITQWLHTGDLGYLDHEGYLFIVDRKKDMIITRGLNVYPREIEEVLYQHPAILEAAVIGFPDDIRGEIVKAFVVLKTEKHLEKKELIAFLKKKLAAYKLPRVIEFIAELPKNASGKINKKDLKKT